MNDDSIATHMYWHVLSVLLTGQKKKKKKKRITQWSSETQLTEPTQQNPPTTVQSCLFPLTLLDLLRRYEYEYEYDHRTNI